MGGKIQEYECNLSMIWFPWATILIYLSLFGIWKVQLKTMYIAVKLANSFWIWIFVFGKIWMYRMLPWFKIVIYLSLFGIWKVQFKTMYIAVILANSFWIWIFLFGKRWMYNHMLCYWWFTCAIEFYFIYLYLHLYVPRNSVRLVWLNSWQCLLTSRID